MNLLGTIVNAVAKPLGRTASRAAFAARRVSPELGIIFGIGGAIVGIGMLCKETLDADKVIKETKETLNKIEECVEDPDIKYTKENEKKDLQRVYVQSGVKLVKTYAPGVGIELISLVSIVGSHYILRKRNIALAAAYAAVSDGFKEYRKRVADRFGTDVEREIRYNIGKEQVKEVIVDPETGEEKVVESEISTVNPHLHSPYAKFFEQGSRNWSKDPEYNLMFLKAQQTYLNDRLVARGHVFLNEVYDALDIPRTKAGNVVGWIYDKKNPIGDNYIDFGIYELNNVANRNFVNGYENVILLDFNVDGNILDLLP